MCEATHRGETFCAISVQTAPAPSDIPVLKLFKQEINEWSYLIQFLSVKALHLCYKLKLFGAP